MPATQWVPGHPIFRVDCLVVRRLVARNDGSNGDHWRDYFVFVALRTGIGHTRVTH